MVLTSILFYCNDLESKCSCITLIGTLPKYQSKGYAHALLKASEEMSKANQMIRCRLETEYTNNSSISFYCKNGYVKEVLSSNGTVHVSNSDNKTVAFHYADYHVITPLIYDDYIPFLLDYCKKNKIGILISLFDINLLVLARNKEKFEAISPKVIVSNPKIIEVCNDKWKTYLFSQEHGFYTLATYLSLDDVKVDIDNSSLQCPLIVKPRFGCGSISISIAEDEEDLYYLYRKISRAVKNSYLKYESATSEEKVIIQQHLDGQEYGADLINDLYAIPQSVTVRKKIAMRSDETDITELIDEPLITNEATKLANIGGGRGYNCRVKFPRVCPLPEMTLPDASVGELDPL